MKRLVHFGALTICGVGLAVLTLLLPVATGFAQTDPVIAVDPSSYDFGDVVEQVQIVSQAFFIINEGNTDLVVHSVSIVGDPTEFWLATLGWPFTLPPGERASVLVSFSPNSVGPKNAALRVISSATSQSPLDVSLTGNGLPLSTLGQIAASPVPNNDTPTPNQRITVAVVVDMSGANPPADLLESYQANLSWDPTVLQYAGFTPGDIPLGTVDQSNAGNGSAEWYGFAGPAGASGTFRIINFNFLVIGNAGSTTDLDLEFSRMEGQDVENLLPILNTRDGSVQVQGEVTPPDIAVTPRTYDYGMVALNSSRAQTFVVSNTGMEDLIVSEMRLEGDNADQFSIDSDTDPFTLASGQSRDVVVSFNPTYNGGAKTATLLFVSNDPDEPVLPVVLVGNQFVPAPNIVVEPSSHDYGDVPLGVLVSKTFVVRNTGTAPLLRLSTGLEGEHENQFSFSLDTPLTEFIVLAPGESRDIEIYFVPTSVGQKNATMVIVSTDPDELSVEVPLTGNGVAAQKIAVNPSSYDYGTVPVGSSASQTIEVSNVGTADLEVNAISLAGADPDQFSIDSDVSPSTLAPGERRDVVVTFAPTSETSKSAILRIESNDPAQATVDVPLTGSGAPTPVPNLVVNPSAIYFGEIRIDSTAFQTFVISNDGTADLVVDAITVGGADADQFSVQGGTTPFTLSPGESQEVIVNYSPKTDGAKSAILQIANNDPDNTVFDLPLSGRVPPSLASLAIRVDIPEVTGRPRTSVTIPILVDDVTGKRVLGYQTIIRFDPRVLELTGVSSAGTLSDRFGTPVLNILGPGRIRVGGLGTLFLTGGGTLVNLHFNIIGQQGDMTDLRFETFQFNLGLPPAITDDGKLTVSGEGKPEIVLDPSSIDYGNVLVGTKATQTLTVSNPGTADLLVDATTVAGVDADQFSIDDGGAPFVLSPGESRDIQISFNPTSEGMKSAKLQIFCEHLGDASLDVPLSGISISPFSVPVYLPKDAIAIPGASVNIPIDVGDLTGKFVFAYGAVVQFNPTVLRAKGASSAGTLSEPFGPPKFVMLGPDLLLVGGFGPTPLSGAGTLVNLQFDVVGQPGDVSPLTFVKFVFNGVGKPDAATNNGRFTVVAPPDIAVNPTHLEFGEVEVGKELDLIVEVSNEGDLDLEVSATDLIGPNADQWKVTKGAAPFVLGPGETRQVTVCFNPSSPGAKSATLRIRSNDPDEDPFDVPLTGEGFRPPHLAISPTSHDYGDVEVGKFVDQTFILRNESSATKNGVGKARLRGDREFRVVKGYDFDIPPGGSHEIVVRFDCRDQEPMDPNATLRITSNDPHSPIIVPLTGECVEPIQPNIATSPEEEVKFGKVWVGSGPEKVLTVRNDGNDDLRITAIELRGSNRSEYAMTGAEVPLVLRPGERHEIMVRFSPASEGLKVAHIRFWSNDPDQEYINVFLSGTGVLNPVPDINAAPVSVDFGNPPYGGEASRKVTVSNEGYKLLEVSAISLSGPDADQWKLTAGGAPFTLEPGESRDLTLLFHPTTEGEKSATLRIRSNDSDEDPLDVSLRGYGSGPPTAHIQLVHNAPDPSLGVMDVYANGTLVADDMPYRSATPFVELPAGVPIELTLAPGSSASADDGLKKIEINLETDSVYVLVASGVSDSTAYAENPDARSLELDLFMRSGARRAGTSETAVDMVAHHGSPDAGKLNIVARGLATLADSASYGDTGAYVGLPPSMQILDIMASTDSSRMAAFDADLTGLAGASAFVFTSGFVDPAQNNNGPAFGLFAALADGTVLEFVRITTPRIAVEPSALAYGEVGLGSGAEKSITISNTGALPLEVSEIVPEGANADQWKITEGGAPFTLQPGDSRDVTVYFEPSSAGEKNGSLRIVSNDPNAPSVEVALSGKGIQRHFPDIAARPVELKFGPVEIGSEAEKNLLIMNKGDEELEVSAMEMRGSNRDQYKILRAEAPFVLAPGESKKIMIQFAPTAEDRQIAHVRFWSNDPDEAIFNVFITGRGVPSLVAKKESGLNTAELGEKAVIPKEFSLSQNYPNPFNPETLIQFGLPKATPTRLEIYDVQGRMIRRLVDGNLAAGFHLVRWDGTDTSGKRVSSGVYFYRLEAGDFLQAKQMTLVK